MTKLLSDAPDLAVFTAGVALGLLIGWIATVILLAQLRGLAKRRGWDAGLLLADGLGRAPLWWGGLAGGAAALDVLEWHPRLELYATRTLAVLAIVTLTVVSARIVGALVRRSTAEPGAAVPSTSIFVNLARIVVVLLGGILILNALNIPVTPILTALGVGGLAVALALQETLGNLFAGLQIVASKQVRPGDYLLLDSGQEGTVEDIAWRTTTLRTQADNLVIVPNATLGKSIVTNFRLPVEPLALTVEFGVPYDADLERVEAVVIEVAAETMRELQPSLAGTEPVVRFKALAESQITAMAVLRAPAYVDQFPLRSAFIKRLHARFTEEGIGFAVPQRIVRQVDDA